jgi:CTD small phosphatase-like protein 2
MISASLYRDKCVVSEEGVHIKDLRVIGRDLKEIILVDNAAYSFG